MAGTDASTHELRDPALRRDSHSRQVRRAWTLLLGGFAILLVFLGVGLYAGRWYILHATMPEPATLQPVTGQGVLIHSPGQSDWRLVTGDATAREGDTISTNSGTVGWVTLFDRGTVEVSENSMVALNRMRTSRFLSSRKEFSLEPIRGTIYVGMAPRGDSAQSQMVVSAGPARVTMRDAPRSSDTGSFLVEVQRENAPGNGEGAILSVRVGVLRGIAEVETSQGVRTLSADEQTIISSTGAFGPVTEAVRELVRNGDFTRGLSDWVEYQDQGDDAGSVFGVVQRVPAEIDGSQQVAVELSRSSANIDHSDTGIQQKINQTLRVYSSLLLQADIKIDEQQPQGGGRNLTEYPMILRLNYIDLQGQTREWWHGFYIQPDWANPVPKDRATLVSRGDWHHVQFDLRNVTPLPRQISSILVYASGHGYASQVANISLSSSDAGQHR